MSVMKSGTLIDEGFLVRDGLETCLSAVEMATRYLYVFDIVFDAEG